MHLLQSVVMLIDWCDRLHFERRRDAAITREDLTQPLPADDLIVRAARAIQAETGCRHGAHIGIEKHIPSQAGLGGGSSDAASCLLALNRLWGLGLPLSALERIGLTLGADVPFFLRGRNAWVEGVGERITPIDLPRSRFAVLKPSEGLPTAAIFGSPMLKRNCDTATIAGFAANPWGFGRNELQPVAAAQCTGVAQALGAFEAIGLQGRLTGSGSAVFARLPQGGCSTKSLSELPTGWHYRDCGNLQAHPLLGWAADEN